MIGVEGQFLFRFSIPNAPARLQDFLVAEELEVFHIHEEAGNVLPTFEMKFVTTKSDLLKYLNEGNTLDVSFGKTSKDMVDIKLSITRYQQEKIGQDAYSISLIGIYSARSYITIGEIDIFQNKSGVETILEVAAKNFTVNSNITKSNDTQNWVQHNITRKKFINNVWMHSHLPNSFIAVGISSDGKFIVKDVVKELKDKSEVGGWDYRFIYNISKSNDIRYDGDHFIDIESGFINHWVGYGRRKVLFNMEDSVEDTSIFEELKPLLAQTKTLMRSSEVSERIGQAAFQNDNVHESYWSAYLKNLQYLAAFGSVKVVLSFHDNFVPLRVLDVAMFMDVELASNAAAGTPTGLYLVKEVSRVLMNNQMTTTVVLGREGLNEVQGDLR